jgi:hypothetical protein
MKPFGQWPTQQITWVVALGAFICVVLLWMLSAAVAIFRGCDPATGFCAQPIAIDESILIIIVGGLAIERTAFIGKRWTSYKPTEVAQAEQIRNGGGVDGSIAARRADDEYGGEFAGHPG